MVLPHTEYISKRKIYNHNTAFTEHYSIQSSKILVLLLAEHGWYNCLTKCCQLGVKLNHIYRHCLFNFTSPCFLLITRTFAFLETVRTNPETYLFCLINTSVCLFLTLYLARLMEYNVLLMLKTPIDFGGDSFIN